MSTARYVALAVALALSQNLLRAQEGPPPLPSTEELTALLQAYDVPGASMAFLGGCEVMATQTAGYARLSPDVPVEDNTLFEAASLSKPVFAYLVMQLVDEGVVDLDEPFAADFDYPRITDKDAFAKLTPRLVLTHRTGLPNWVEGDVLFSEQTAPLPFEAAPGERYSYSGEAFMLLQGYVESRTGKSLETLFRERLGDVMPHSTFEEHRRDPALPTSRGYAGVLDTGYSRQLAYRKVAGRPETSALAPASLLTTAADYGAFLAHVCKAEGLESATHAEMLRAQAPVPFEEAGMPASYGLGWMMVEMDGQTFAVHSGNNGEYRALAGFMPATGEGFIVLTNGARGQDFADVMSLPPPMPPPGLSGPETTFEMFWRHFDDGYGLFGVKGIDWDAVYALYRPQVTPETTDAALWQVLTQVAGLLNDAHVTLRDAAGDRFFRSGARGLSVGDADDGRFSLATVEEQYVMGSLRDAEMAHLRYGWLPDSLGYVRIERFGEATAAGAGLDTALAYLEGVRGLIVDVRHNGGGQDRAARALASRFADEERLFMTTEMRKLGMGREAFAEPLQWRIRPTGPRIYTGPVVVLQDDRTVSAAENFLLAMRTLPHVTTVGGVTAGAMADTPELPLPNGWTVGVPINVMRDAEGRSYEGLGLAPQVHVVNEAGAVAAGKDHTLQLGIRWLGRRNGAR